MLRIWLIAMLAAAALVVVRDHDLLHRTDLIGHCASTTAPAGARGAWRACERGVLDGRPNLSQRSCRRQGRSGSVEFWSCPARVKSAAAG